MKIRHAVTAALVGALLLALSAPAAAITGGSQAPDTAPYDAVGQLLLAFEVVGEDGEVTEHLHLSLCTGTYVHAGEYAYGFLTAAHCTFDDPEYGEVLAQGLTAARGAQVDYVGLEVTFDEAPWSQENLAPWGGFWKLAESTSTIPVMEQTLGGYGEHPGRQDDRDIALLSLAAAPHDIVPVAVDTDSLTTLSRRELRAASWVSVGYGATYDRERGAPMMGRGGTRLVSEAPGGFLALRPGGLYLSQNQARGHGGTCYGDSGGPIFLDHEGEDLKLVAITSWGDTNCIATNLTYRLDTPTALEVLEPGDGQG